MHTAESSACASASAREQVIQYRSAGYDGILVTDHFINGNSAVDRSLPWDQMMADQFKGYREAAIAGEELNFKVYQGIEYAYHGTEFLVIGLGQEWFTSHPEVVDMKPKEFLNAFRDAGAAVIQAHPYRQASYIKTIRLFPDEVDAIEGFNHRNDREWNDDACHLALIHNKPVTAGSDCHRIGECHSGIAVERPIEDTADLIRLIKGGTGWTTFEEIRKVF